MIQAIVSYSSVNEQGIFQPIFYILHLYMHVPLLLDCWALVLRLPEVTCANQTSRGMIFVFYLVRSTAVYIITRNTDRIHETIHTVCACDTRSVCVDSYRQ